MPGILAPAIALLEIGGGALLITGLGTRLLSGPFIIEMIVAILSTKVSLFFGTSPLPGALGGDRRRGAERIDRHRDLPALAVLAFRRESASRFPERWPEE
jgi:hypothetical protein